MSKFSKHVERRIRQRGGSRLMRAVLKHADRDVPVGANCRALSVHRRTARALNLSDGLSRCAVVVSDRTGRIVTFLHHRRGWRGRRYRRGR